METSEGQYQAGQVDPPAPRVVDNGIVAAFKKELEAAALKSRIRISGERGPLFAALAKAQADFEPIPKTETATVQGETAGGKSFSYQFSYAPLENILAACVPALNAQGLFFSQPLASNENGGHQLRTWLCHSSGAMIELETDIPTDPRTKIQQLGSAITYLRRYVAQSVLGVSAEEDDDGNAADGNQRQRMQRTPPPPPQPRPSAAPQGRPAPAPAPVAPSAPSAASTPVAATTEPPKPGPAAAALAQASNDMLAARAAAKAKEAPPPAPPADVVAEPEGITADQDSEIGQLCKALKYSRTRATEFTFKLLGVGPAHVTREGADKLIAALKEQMAPGAA